MVVKPGIDLTIGIEGCRLLFTQRRRQPPCEGGTNLCKSFMPYLVVQTLHRSWGFQFSQAGVGQGREEEHRLCSSEVFLCKVLPHPDRMLAPAQSFALQGKRTVEVHVQ